MCFELLRDRGPGGPEPSWPGATRLVVALVLLLVLAAPALAARVALVVGNGDYAHLPSLPNPGNDAEAIGAKLDGMGFDVQIVVDANLETLRRELAAFGLRARGAEIALVFYAGHGMQVEGTNYLLPTEIRLRAREDLERAALLVGEVFDEVGRAAPEASIVILDACRDNPFAQSLGAAPGLAGGSVTSAGFARRPNAAGTVIAFAAAPGAVAFDGADGHSPYTTALLRWIDRPGLEVATMLRRVRGTVLQLTGGAQVPWVEEALVQNVYLSPGDPGGEPLGRGIEAALIERIRSLDAPTEQSAARSFYDRYLAEASFDAAGPSAEEDERFVREGLIWLSIRQGSDPETFEAFIAEFPDGAFAELARARLDLVRREAAPDAALPRDQAAAPAPAAAGPADVDGGGPAPPEPTSAPEPSIVAAPPSPAEVEAKLGLDRDELAAIQLLLREAGVYGGATDADFGPGTRGGIEAFQTAAGLPPTGHLDPATLQALVARAAPAVLRRDVEGRDGVHRLAAVAARGAGAEPVVIRVEAIDRNEAVHAYWNKIAREFEADRPGTRIEINHQPGVRYRAELMSILGSETPPDVLYTWGGGHLDALREAGFARDLTAEMGEGWALEFKPSALRTYTHEGRVHGVPMHLSVVSLYANAAVFDRAGVPIESLETWEGLLAAVRRLGEAGVVPIAIGGGDRWPFNLYFGPLAQRLGGRDAFEAGLSGEGEGFAGPAFRRAGAEFERLSDLDPFQPGYLEMDDGQAVEMFSEGDAAMVVTGNGRLRKMRWSWPGGPEAMDAELRQLDFPTIGDRPQESFTYGGADGFAVSATAPEAAVDFLRRLTAFDVQERMADLVADVPSLSGVDLALADGFLAEAADELLTSTYHQLYFDQALGPEVGEELNDAMTGLAAGAITAEEAVLAVDGAWDRVELSR